MLGYIGFKEAIEKIAQDHQVKNPKVIIESIEALVSPDFISYSRIYSQQPVKSY
jgi:hypothetical protein